MTGNSLNTASVCYIHCYITYSKFLFLENIENIKNIEYIKISYFLYFDVFENILIFSSPVRRYTNNKIFTEI